MFDKIVQRAVNFIFTYGNANEDKREIYEYGIEINLMYLINAGTLLLLGLFAGLFWETLLLLFGYALLQSFAGGYHAMTHLRCFLIMLVSWGGTMLVLPLIESYRYLPLMLAVLGLLSVFLFAPVKHVNFPMSKEKEQKMKNLSRTISIIFCIIVFVFCFFQPKNNMFTSVLGITLFLTAISITCAKIRENLQKKLQNNNINQPVKNDINNFR